MRLFFVFIILFPLISNSQFFPKRIGEVTGLVKFAIWEEDSIGNLIAGSKEVLFQHNYSTEIIYSKHADKISTKEMTDCIFQCVSIPQSTILLKKIVLNDTVTQIKKKLVLKREVEKEHIYLAFVKRKGEWLVMKRELPLMGDTTTTIPKRVLIFINGYRGYEREKNESDNLVTSKDRYHYWFKLDDRFIDTLKPKDCYYLDGSMSVKTSNHRNTLRFIRSFFFSTHFLNRSYAADNYNRLNEEPNPDGFQYRRDKGRIGGKALFLKLNPNQKDTVDIVCHSMGYAYTLGIIDELKEKVVLGKIYILSPENGCQDGVDWKLFQQVWQYGSNLDQPNPDPLWEQDGIAPQCAVKGMIYDSNHGRAFIPKDWPKKNFIDSHMPYNYDWIFDRIKKGEPGFIGR